MLTPKLELSLILASHPKLTNSTLFAKMLPSLFAALKEPFFRDLTVFDRNRKNNFLSKKLVPASIPNRISSEKPAVLLLNPR